MTARTTLLGLYEEWRLQTEAEGEAIRAQDWSRVGQCQQAKHELQPLIQDWTGAARREHQATGRQPEQLQQELRQLLQQLAQAEVRNQKWLNQHQRALGARRAELQQTTHTLRRVHQSYRSGDRCLWQSYS